MRLQRDNQGIPSLLVEASAIRPFPPPACNRMNRDVAGSRQFCGSAVPIVRMNRSLLGGLLLLRRAVRRRDDLDSGRLGLWDGGELLHGDRVVQRLSHLLLPGAGLRLLRHLLHLRGLRVGDDAGVPRPADVEHGGGAVGHGDVGLMVVGDVFTLWWEYREGLIDRGALGRQLEPLIEELHLALEHGSGCADPKVMAFCDNLLTLYPALWLFAGVEGVEPTNNHAERILRMGVLWRKNAFGCHSASGCRFVERILTVVQTLRLQKRSVLSFLEETVIAHRLGTPGPALVVPK